MTNHPHIPSLVIRLATRDDIGVLELLADLDSARPPQGPTLIGELRGRPVAALELSDQRKVADPFVATGEVVELLRIRARQLRIGTLAVAGERPPGLTGWAAASRKAVGKTRDRLHGLLKGADVAVE